MTYIDFAGIPVWVGRKLYTRYQKANKHKRNAFVAGGVTASVSQNKFYLIVALYFLHNSLRD